jgi:O-antigen/teichoic acid export membrane protein
VATVAALTVFFTDSFRAATFSVLIAINKAVEAVSDVYQGLLQQRERMDSLGRSFIWKGTAVLASFGITYAVTHDLLLAAAATFLAQVLTLLLYDAREAERTIRGTRDSGLRVLAGDLREITWNALSLRSLAARALPLGISMMLVSSYSSLPRLILDKYAGAAGVGLFAAIAYLPNIGLMVVNAIGTAVCPRLSIYDIQRNSTAFWKLLTKLLFFTAVMGVIGIAISITAGPIVLRLLYGQEYALHNDVLVYNMAGALFAYLSTILGYAATARGQFAGQPWAMGIAIFVLWVSSLMLVPAHGVTGASLAVVISSIVWLCCYVVLLLWTRRRKRFSLLG